MIKLQLLLRHPSPDIALDPVVRAALEAHGFIVTGSGRASVSAQMTEANFEKLFGPSPPVTAGFARLTSPELPLPPGLESAVSLITITPRHSAMHNTPRANHAAI